MKKLLFAVGVALASTSVLACTAVIVGKKASATGRVLVGHNEDGGGSVVRHAYVPAADGNLAFYWTEIKHLKGGVIPGDMLLNEKGVLILSNNGGFMKTWCGRPGQLPDEGEASALVDGGVGFELRRDVALKARTAREGVDIATNLLSRFGYNFDSRLFTIADADEAWILEAIRGKRYVARRVPDDAVVVHPNCLSVREIRPGDIVSANIAAKGADFDFTAAYQGPRTWASPYNLYRWKSLYRATCGVELPETEFPFAVKPQKPVTVEMIKRGLRSHHEGTPQAVEPHPSRDDEKAERLVAPICRGSTQESIVCAFAAAATNTVLWSATGRPCETPYACYRPLAGLLPTDTSRGEMALKRLREHAQPLPPPAKVCIYAGKGPKSNGACEYARLVEASPELELTLVDAEMIRCGALEGHDLLIVPGGSSKEEKKDLGPKGAEKIKEFLRNGGNYIGSCAGCCLLMDSVMDPERGIGIIPYYRTGSKGGYMMPVKVNAKGAKALGIDEKVYEIRYHGGPVLEPSTNAIEGAKFEIWATYDADFQKPGSKPEMYGRGAMVGGTFGQGRVFAFTVHPENYRVTRELLRGAFRYALGRDVTFPERVRKPGALSVGWFTAGVSGTDPVRAMLTADSLPCADLFPITSSEVDRNMLDHVDVLVLPSGDMGFYKKGLRGIAPDLTAFVARGGRIIGWGAGAKAGPAGTQAFSDAAATVAELKRISEELCK